ncbi:MAG: PfkB family carbohydrate kinase [Candidatus Omnitrophica bacterium]|nr:PfkB family carbohydrate kinase [Candidatus Omnitrophota bacterium]
MAREKISHKIKSLNELAAIVAKTKRAGKKVVLCHGVFDLLHPGHIRHFSAAKEKGDVLVVTITRDDFVNKGPGRPVFSHNLRAESIAAFECVDYVAINDAPTAVGIIKLIKPDYYVKGKEYSKKDEDLTGKIYDEENAVRSVGGDIHFTEDITFSSTALLNIHFKVFPEDAGKFLRNFKKKYNSEKLIEKLKKMKDLKVLVIGDIIIDEYRYCSGIGKPQKANVIATKYLYDERFAGGSLAVANHVAGFCKHVQLVSLLGGRNPEGGIIDYKKFISEKLRPNVKRKIFSKKELMTVVKRRFLDPSFLGKMFELAFIDDFVLDKKLEAKIVDYLKEELKKYDVVIASDFGHGLITKRIVDVLSKHAKFLAVNTQTNSANRGFNLITKYPRADYISIDEPEIQLAMHDRFSGLETLIGELRKKIACQKITVTRGHLGALVYFKKGGFFPVPVFSQEIVDRIGAGDACLSVSSLAAASDFSVEEVGFICNAVGALAVLIVGNRSPVDPVTLYKFITTLLK